MAVLAANPFSIDLGTEADKDGIRKEVFLFSINLLNSDQLTNSVSQSPYIYIYKASTCSIRLCTDGGKTRTLLIVCCVRRASN